jgi:hypothetical protein
MSFLLLASAKEASMLYYAAFLLKYFLAAA